jgi:hypothetical protein
MGVLTSTLFTDGDQVTVNKLEDCATGQPNEVQSHFSVGQRGEHIRRAQEALKSAQRADPSLGLPEFSVNAIYDQNFANAIFAYKTKRDIRNFANKIDEIVGIKTIRSLDQEQKSNPPRENPAVPPKLKKSGDFERPLPKCVPDSVCPSSNEFDIRLVLGVSGGEIVEFGEFFFAIRDTTNGLSSFYKLRVGGVGAGTSPITPAGGGGTQHFRTSHPVRVTRFGPMASMGSVSVESGIPQVSRALITLGFKPDGLRAPRLTAPISIDTGPIIIKGASLHAGQLIATSRCGEEAGASRRVLGPNDPG